MMKPRWEFTSRCFLCDDNPVVYRGHIHLGLLTVSIGWCKKHDAPEVFVENSLPLISINGIVHDGCFGFFPIPTIRQRHATISNSWFCISRTTPSLSTPCPVCSDFSCIDCSPSKYLTKIGFKVSVRGIRYSFDEHERAKKVPGVIGLNYKDNSKSVVSPGTIVYSPSFVEAIGKGNFAGCLR